MIIALDVGNTNIMLGCLDEGGVRFTARLASDARRTADEYAMMLKALLDLNGVSAKEIEGGIISSVVPVLAAACRDAVEKLTGKQPMVVGAGVKTGLNILIDNPAQLGSDLVVDAVAAITEYKEEGRPILVFDMGTATTLSVVDAKGGYIGGAIMPGVNLALDALFSRTSQLPRINLESPKRVIGSNTVDCMKSGAVFGNAAMLDGLIERAEAELGMTATVIATGGLSRSIVPYCKREILCDDNLLLKGLLVIYKKNVKN